MSPNVYDNISSFQVWPKKTFLGLDKSKAHCFTLPKSITQSVIETFNLRSGYLQQNIIFVIDGMDFQATARMIIMDRSKPNKLEKEELPGAICNWVSFKADRAKRPLGQGTIGSDRASTEASGDVTWRCVFSVSLAREICRNHTC